MLSDHLCLKVSQFSQVYFFNGMELDSCNFIYTVRLLRQKLRTEGNAVLNFERADSKHEDTTEIKFHFDCNMDQASCQVDHHNTSG